MLIIVTGLAEAFDENDNKISKVNELKKLNDLTYNEDSCTNYLDETLDSIDFKGGDIKIKYDSSSKNLRVTTEYRSPRKLKKNELIALSKQTQEQWSDGIGENCFDKYTKKHGIRIDLWPNNSATITQIDDGVKTPRKRYSRLFGAVKKNDQEKIISLLEKGADINSKNKDNQTPLTCSIHDKNWNLALLLIDHGAEVNGHHMYWAAVSGQLNMVKTLLNKGVNIDNQDSFYGATPLMWACNRGHINVVEFLIKNGCNLNLQDTSSKNTALMYARPKDLDLIKLLLESGADPKIKNNEGKDAYHEALFQAEAMLEYNDEKSHQE